MYAGSLTLIDVRDSEELSTQGKIPKSINIPCKNTQIHD
jgi:hypothetical protein